MEVYMMFAKLALLDHWAKEPHAMMVELTPAEIESHTLERDITKHELLAYSHKLTKALSMVSPGAVFKLTKEEGHIKYMKHQRPEFIMNVNDQIGRWHSEDRATRRSWEAMRRLEREAKSDPDYRWLNPFKDAYKRLPGPARAQLVADVVAYIVRS